MEALLPLGGQEGMYDNALMGILQSCGKLQPFLDAVFSFLARRTDFYIIMQHDRAKMGFPPGVSEGMVIQAFKKYEILTRKREAEIMREEETRRIEQMVQEADQCSATIDDELPITLPSSHDASKDIPKPKPKALPEPTSTQSVATKPDSPTKSTPPDSRKKGKKREKTDTKGKTAEFNLSSETYNGAVMENYRWSQTITDLDIRVPVPEVTTAKDVRVDIRSDHLRVELLRPERKLIIDKPLLHRIKVEESMWSVDKEMNCVLVNLEKTKEIMWKSVLEGEDGIDLTKVDTTRNISEFDAEAQAAIERVTYDHHMKMLGRPTSNEQKAHEILKKAWNAEGSPFKGTPFDPSRVHIAGVW